MALALAFLAADHDAARAEAPTWRTWRKPVPDFILPALDGDDAAFAGADDRIVLVHFFATWCLPCRAELPALQRFAARAGAARLKVLVVSVAEPDSRVRRLRDELALTLPILLDRDRAVTKAWQVALLPTSVVFGPGSSTRFGVEADMAWDQVDPDALIRAATPPRPEPGARSGEPPPELQREEAHSEGG
ncbi:Thiol-disulfide oxidoreductase ResA [bacterium YEK0313]|nr:Thiol-disulfide oxidoreductase ResA [bacterium YEK0313]